MSLATEDEARERWCPFARVSASGRGNAGLGNRYSIETDLFEGHAFARCLGSTCMAWRWGIERHDGKPTIEELEKILDGPEPHIEILPSGEVVSTTKGYCGLAGKP